MCGHMWRGGCVCTCFSVLYDTACPTHQQCGKMRGTDKTTLIINNNNIRSSMTFCTFHKSYIFV